MSYLLDTHILLWAAAGSDRLTSAARRLIDDPANTHVFSAASLWEVAIKSGLGRNDFQVDAQRLRKGLIDSGYVELPVTGAHAAAVAGLPPVHRDPFDRLLIAQAQVEGLEFVTADRILAQYGGPIRLV
ncbi:type II toxin-antitoxin system VapC family toxin [Methylobacterium pseudosasicola]|uniref:PIN domain nuclease, a component of toxin-antitoxin system (PIN domain) n=1 Tax=Methylobacterium pseudosasicola TaxID=582667 RepID=A0A1I4LR53_9HYPH|nr:type II toxin-antitoxin system VapC family toxin [Methylobacterium pseudosasicola]SFL93326.1 PIN domain nuclease, a component of toxin-antitoxin system (PIN domain) [Methylobacterium pseudosasicola]